MWRLLKLGIKSSGNSDRPDRVTSRDQHWNCKEKWLYSSLIDFIPPTTLNFTNPNISFSFYGANSFGKYIPSNFISFTLILALILLSGCAPVQHCSSIKHKIILVLEFEALCLLVNLNSSFLILIKIHHDILNYAKLCCHEHPPM